MKLQQYKQLLKKNGVEIQHVGVSGRIRGCSVAVGHGVSFSEVFPWKSSSSKNGVRVNYIISDRNQRVYINGSEEQLAQVQNVFSNNNVSFEVSGSQVVVLVENPYSEEESLRAFRHYQLVVGRR